MDPESHPQSTTKQKKTERDDIQIYDLWLEIATKILETILSFFRTERLLWSVKAYDKIGLLITSKQVGRGEAPEESWLGECSESIFWIHFKDEVSHVQRR